MLTCNEIGFETPEVELEHLLSFERVSKPATPESFKLDLSEEKLKSRVTALCQYMTLAHVFKETNELWDMEPKEKVEKIFAALKDSKAEWAAKAIKRYEA